MLAVSWLILDRLLSSGSELVEETGSELSSQLRGGKQVKVFLTVFSQTMQSLNMWSVQHGTEWRKTSNEAGN